MDEIESIIIKPEIMWCPGMFGKTKIDIFRESVNKKYKINLKDYWELYEWSTKHYDCFWEEFLHYSQIILTCPYNCVVDVGRRIDQIPRWFISAKLNYAQNIFDHPSNRAQSKIGLYVTSESQTTVECVTLGDIKRTVTRLVSAMKRMGVTVGDRVFGYLPNGREAVEAFLATSAIGAIWSSTSPDFGIAGVLDRICQIRPKLMFSIDAVIYNGKRHDHLEKIKIVAQKLDGLEKVVVSSLKQDKEGEENGLSDFDNNNNHNHKVKFSEIPNYCTYEEFLSTGNANEQLQYEQLPFDHPLCILFSSGTTGVPKCLVHSVGGTLIKHLEEHLLQGNMNDKDILLYYTTIGWMMWNWMVSALATGASIVLYDGSPFHPSPTVIWDLIDKIGVTIFGTSAKGLQTMESFGLNPMKTHKLSSLHTILSTGSPLKPQSYEYVYNKIKKDLLLGSISGGSDIIACFVGQNPTVPVHKGQVQSRNLGMAVECWDEHGNNVFDTKGELVCTKPFPSMPTKFWNDQDGKKYKKAYFSHFKGVWTHGDFCLINSKTNGVVMLGRSDGTLNPNGVRFGSSEIYNIVESYEEIMDCVCVSQYNSKGEERVVLFLKMNPGFDFGEKLISKIKTDIRMKLSARHVPGMILQTKDIPYTINGKKVEVAVKFIINGKEVNNKNAIANPESLKYFENLPELQNYE